MLEKICWMNEPRAIGEEASSVAEVHARSVLGLEGAWMTLTYSPIVKDATITLKRFT